ncbi:hypothetical protein ACROYT_G030891 [Oculina patagonica]
MEQLKAMCKNEQLSLNLLITRRLSLDEKTRSSNTEFATAKPKPKMKMLAVLPLFIVALCVVESRVSAVPIPEPKHELDRRDVIEGCPGGWTEFGAYYY